MGDDEIFKISKSSETELQRTKGHDSSPHHFSLTNNYGHVSANSIVGFIKLEPREWTTQSAVTFYKWAVESRACPCADQGRPSFQDRDDNVEKDMKHVDGFGDMATFADINHVGKIIMSDIVSMMLKLHQPGSP